MNHAGDRNNSSLPEGRRVWIRAFRGFAPEDDGYIGFTNKGNRDRFIEECEPGDLVMIYGADQQLTSEEQRRQVLGFLEVDATPCMDVDRSSEDGYRRKVANGWRERWRFAVPVRRAWRVTRRIEAHHLARVTFQMRNPILIASRAELLTPSEAAAAIRLPVKPANVFGEPPLSEDELSVEAPLETFCSPSRGVTPSYGERSFTVEDGENRLYVLKLQGSAAAFLGRQPFEVARKAVVKVGHAKDPQARCDTHNAHLPKKCAFKWSVAMASPPFPNGEAAKRAEDSLKEYFAARFESLGGEFYLGDQSQIEIEFANVTRSLSFVIAL